MKRAIYAVGLIIVVGAILLGAAILRDIANDRATSIEILCSSPLFASFSLVEKQPSAIAAVAIVQVGAPVRVLRIRYGKDDVAFKVQTADGKIGWLTYNGKNLRFRK